MKKTLIVVIALLLNVGSALSDEKDSVDKYKGTTYIGDIHKEYD